MESVLGSPHPHIADASPIATPAVSRFRLYTLRVCYLILAAGLGAYVWPSVVSHTSDFALQHGIQTALLAGLGLTAALGLRYPVQMLPLLLFVTHLEGDLSRRLRAAALASAPDHSRRRG